VNQACLSFTKLVDPFGDMDETEVRKELLELYKDNTEGFISDAGEHCGLDEDLAAQIWAEILGEATKD